MSACIQDLKAMLGEERVVTDEAVLRLYDGFNRSYEKSFGVCMTVPPVAIVFVESTQEISQVLRYCNEHRINVIPRAGASSAEGLLETWVEGSVVVDCTRMNKLLELDTYNMMATVQCGYPLEELERQANQHKLTTGHSPQSRPLAMMGGLVATRSIGQFSTYYGGIEDMVCGLEAVMADGRIVRIRNVPRRSAGPDLRHLFLGSEGGIGFITEVTVKLFPYYPEHMWMGGYIVDNIDVGFAAIRDVMVEGYKPAVIRLYDKSDMDHNFGSVKLKEQEAFMFFTAEGPQEISQGTGAGIDRIARRHGARYIGTQAVEHWMEHRNDLCKTVGAEETDRRHRETQVFYATLEISASWSDIVKIYRDVMVNVPGKIENLVMLGGHVSHSYINGTNIYFVYQLKMNAPETSEQEQMALIRAICDEVIKYPTGGVVHHHGMGKQRVCYARQEHGSSYCLMEELKRTFDPNQILNRGVLLSKE